MTIKNSSISRIIRRWATALLAVCLVLFSGAIAQAVDPSPVNSSAQQYSITSSLEPSSQLTQVKQYISFRALGGVPVNRTAASIMDMNLGKMCPDLDTACITSLKQINLNGYFPICMDNSDFMCVEALELKSGAADWQKAEFVKTIDYQATSAEISQTKTDIEQHDPFGGTVHDIGIGTSWKARPELGYPASASGPLVFKMPGLTNAGGSELYTLQAHYVMNATVGANGQALNPSIQDMAVGLIPTVESTSSHGITPITATRTDKWGKTGPRSSQGSGDPLAWENTSSVGYGVAFPKDTRARLTLRLPSTVGGWFHGRLESPDINISPVNAQVNRVVVEANDAKVPITGGWLLKYAPENSSYLDDLHLDAGIQAQDKLLESQGHGGMSGWVWEPRQGISVFHKWEPVLGDTAKGQADLWYFSMMPDTLTSGNKCLQKTDSLQGMITTNAMTYQAGLPAFEGGELAYQVAGLHNDFTGTPFEGSYNLIMRSEAARCLYGFTNAPISAKVSVTSATGEAKVATTTVGEKNGFLHLAATGFTFSDPTIHARLTQAASAKARPTKLTCIKGKLTKTVTGTAPKCPSGFTKK